MTLHNRIMSKEWKRAKKEREEDPETILWNEVGEMYPEDSFVEKNNRTYENRIVNLKNKLNYLKEMLQKMHGFQNPVERVILDERINFLYKAVQRVHLQGKSAPHSAGPDPRYRHRDHQEETVHAERHGERAERIPLRRIEGILGRRVCAVHKAPVDPAGGYRSVVCGRGSSASIIEEAYKVSQQSPGSEISGAVSLSPRSAGAGKPVKKSGLKEL